MIRIANAVLPLAALLFFSIAFAADTAGVPPGLVPEGYRATERHSFNLGAESGSYTDWHRYDLAPFEGFATVLDVPSIYGKSKDKWAAAVKIRFLAKGEAAQSSFALVFMADRKTKRIHAMLERGDDLSRFELDFGLEERVPVVVTWKAPGNLGVRIADTLIEIPVTFEIDTIALVGSGLDVSFSPFVMLKNGNGGG